MHRLRQIQILLSLCSIIAISGSHTLLAQQFISAKNVTPSASNGQSPYGGIIGEADFNLDGNLDILTIYTNPTTQAQSFGLLLGDGHGNFTGKQGPALPKNYSSAMVGDVNGDGKADIVAVVSSNQGFSNATAESTINVYLGNGNGTFRALAPVTISAESASIALLRDVNNDGKLDVITDSVDMNSGSDQTDDFQVFLNNGAGVFHAGSIVQSSSGNHMLKGAGKFYPHSATDLVMLTDDGFQILKNDGHGNFSGGEFLPGTTEGVTVGDFNGDGYDDLLLTDNPIGNNGDGYSQVLINNHDGTFHQTASLNTSSFNAFPYFSTPGYVGDFNHDGKADIAFFSIGGSGESQVGIFLGNGNGTFKSSTSYNLGTQMSAFAVADFNRDGNLDILTSNYYIPFTLAFGDGYGSLSAPRVTVSSGAASLAAADFNGDGVTDFATVNQALCGTCKGSVTVFPGTGKGYMGVGKSYAIGQMSGVVAAGDLNGDGRMDLVVARSSGLNEGAPASAPYDLSVLLGDGEGNFAPAKNYKILGAPASGNISTSVFLADANHDGKLDLIGDWGVALGNGDGTFKKPIPLPAGIQNIVAIGEADFSQNGSVDLAVASSGDGSIPAYVYTLIGNGNGSFRIANKQELAASSYIGSLTAAELNDDGATYLIFTGETFVNGTISSNLWVQRVNSNGSIASTAKYPTAGYIDRGAPIAVGDFNGDGKPDVLVSGADPMGDLTLWYGTGGGKLSSSTEFFQGAMDFLLPVEVDGNHALDVVGVAIWPDDTGAIGSGIERLINTGAKGVVTASQPAAR